MSDVSARYRPDRRQQLSILRKLSIHYAVSGALGGVILGFVILAGVLQSSAAAAALAVGDNVITVAVTAEDGAQQNYMITIHRASS